MPRTVDLYNGAYSNYGTELYRQMRLETYGHDFGQTSWVASDESREIPDLLALTPASHVLELGCGSGGYALHLAERIGCRIVGLDINESGIRNATELAAIKSLSERAAFRQCDISQNLPFEDASFDAVFSNDVLCHLSGRLTVLREMHRVLKPRGRMLFSDALIVGGMLTHEEIATRSSIGFYVYSPPGENERLMEQAGFQQIRVTDTSESAAQIAHRWHQARAKRKKELIECEGEPTFAGLQKFLSCVHTLTSERRLLRHRYVATKPARKA